MSIGRRGFLGALASAPAAIPHAMEQSRAGYAAGGLNYAHPVESDKWKNERITKIRDALSTMDEVPASALMHPTFDSSSVASLKSVSPPIKHLIYQRIEGEILRARRREGLMNELDDLLGKPMSAVRKLRELL